MKYGSIIDNIMKKDNELLNKRRKTLIVTHTNIEKHRNSTGFAK
jgi:hypothetical protein